MRGRERSAAVVLTRKLLPWDAGRVNAFSFGCVFFVGTVAAFAFAACSSSDSLPPLNHDGTTPPGLLHSFDAGTGDGSAITCIDPADGGCSNQGVCGGKVYLVGISGAAPTPAGGTLVPGIYDLVSYEGYNELATFPLGTSSSNWARTTLNLRDVADAGAADAGGGDDAGTGAGASDDAGTGQVLSVEEATNNNNHEDVQTIAGTYTVVGPASLAVEYPCGGGGQTVGFTSTGGKLSIYINDPSTGGVVTETFQAEP